MLLRKHTALQIVCLYAMVTAVCVLGPALSARRHNSSKGTQHIHNIAGVASEHQSFKATNNSTIEQVFARRRKDSGFDSKLFEKNTIPGFAIAHDIVFCALPDYIISATRIVKTYSRLSLPGYYTFLFRYTPF